MSRMIGISSVPMVMYFHLCIHGNLMAYREIKFLTSWLHGNVWCHSHVLFHCVGTPSSTVQCCSRQLLLWMRPLLFARDRRALVYGIHVIRLHGVNYYCTKYMHTMAVAWL